MLSPKLAFAFPLLLLLNACALTFDPETTTSSHLISLHDNPAVGDYAIRDFPMPTGNEKIKWEVLNVEADEVLVKRSWLGEELADIVNEFVLSFQGEVKQAWLIYKGQRYAQRIMYPPETGSLENLTISKNAPRQSIATKAGEFKVSQVQGYVHRVSLGVATVESSSVEYQSDEVPFKILEVRSTFDLDADPFIEFLTKATYTLESIHNNDFLGMFNLDEHTADAEGVQYERLIEFGFGPAH